MTAPVAYNAYTRFNTTTSAIAPTPGIAHQQTEHRQYQVHNY